MTAFLSSLRSSIQYALINLKDDYEAVSGAVTEAEPKVFLKYFYVNTKTGEKSGEMLATVKQG